jgi:hypothetical protein
MKSWNEEFEDVIKGMTETAFIDNVIYVDFKAKKVVKSEQLKLSVEEHWDEFN